MCTQLEFLAEFNPETGPIKEGSIWVDKNGFKCQVIYSDNEKVQVIKETNLKYTSGKRGFNKYCEFELNFFLYIFSPMLK